VAFAGCKLSSGLVLKRFIFNEAIIFNGDVSGGLLTVRLEEQFNVTFLMGAADFDLKIVLEEQAF